MTKQTAIATIPKDSIVARVDHARTLLAEASNPKEAKKVADLARAAQIYAQRQKLGEEAITYARAVVVDAMTLMGEFLKATEKQHGARGLPGPGRGHAKENGRSKRKTVLDAPSVTYREASAAKALVEIKKKAPEVHERVRTGKVSVTKARAEVKKQEKREELKVKAEAAPAADPSWAVLSGDCLAYLRGTQADSVRLVFADPPYNIGFDYGEGYDDAQPREQYLSWVAEWVRECVRVLAPDGSMWVLINDEHAAEYAIILKDAGLTIRNWVIWYEPFGVNCENKFNRTKRHLFYTVKNPDRFVFHADAVSRQSDRQTKYNDARANPDGKILDDVWFDIPRLVGTAAERIPDFPTQLPLALLRRVVGCCTDPGDLVVDPFNGSGTTGVAAVELGRHYVGIERSEKFAELSRLRLRGVQRG